MFPRHPFDYAKFHEAIWPSRNSLVPLHTLRTECAEWDLSNETGMLLDFVAVVRFRPDRRMSEHEIHNPDSSISRSTYSYDDAGQLKEAESVTIGGSVSRATCSAYSYDDARRLIRAAFVDQDGTSTNPRHGVTTRTAREQECTPFPGWQRIRRSSMRSKGRSTRTAFLASRRS